MYSKLQLIAHNHEHILRIEYLIVSFYLWTVGKEYG